MHYGTLNLYPRWQLQQLFNIRLVNKDGAFVDYWLALALTSIPENWGNLDPIWKFEQVINPPTAIAMGGKSLKPVVKFQFRVGSELEPFQRGLSYQTSNPPWISTFLAAFTFRQTQNFRSNLLFEFQSYHNLIYVSIVQFWKHFWLPFSNVWSNQYLLSYEKQIPNIGLHLTATQRILIELQIGEQKVSDHLKLHDVHISHIVIQSKLKYLIVAKVWSSWKWGCTECKTQLESRGYRCGTCLELLALGLLCIFAVPESIWGNSSHSNPYRGCVSLCWCWQWPLLWKFSVWETTFAPCT